MSSGSMKKSKAEECSPAVTRLSWDEMHRLGLQEKNSYLKWGGSPALWCERILTLPI